MTEQEEIIQLEAENASIYLKTQTVGLAGSIAGLLLASKQNKGPWTRVGYFFAGGFIARAPLALYYADKLASNLARIEYLKKEKNL